MQKLIVIIGITGNQGGSVANAFLPDPRWKIRGLTRTPSSSASQSLTAAGIEMVTANLHNPESLRQAFHGANLIFSVTDFWGLYFDEENRRRAEELGVSIGEFAYRKEVEQGRNVADAAASEGVVGGLDSVGLVASTLSGARGASGGRYGELWHFDGKADVFPGYVEERWPGLAAKMSLLQTGFFMSSWKLQTAHYFAKLPNGSYEQRFPTPPNALVPHLDVKKDTGNFVKALLQLPPKTTIMAAGEWCTWPQWIKTWGLVVGKKTSYKQISVADFDIALPGGLGKEIVQMFEYSGDPGYDGGDRSVLRVEDLRRLGVDVVTTGLEEYFMGEDFEAVLDA